MCTWTRGRARAQRGYASQDVLLGGGNNGTREGRMVSSRGREKEVPRPRSCGARARYELRGVHTCPCDSLCARKAGSQPLLDETRPPCRGCEPAIQHLLESATRDATRAIGYYWHCASRVYVHKADTHWGLTCVHTRPQKRALRTCTWKHMCRRLPMDPAD